VVSRIKIPQILTKQFVQKSMMFTLIKDRSLLQCHVQRWELEQHVIISSVIFISTFTCLDLVNVVLMHRVGIVQLLTNLWWQVTLM